MRIVAPPNSGTVYYNYKRGFSVVLMAIVNDNYEFMYVDVGAEGKNADDGVWQDCSFTKALVKYSACLTVAWYPILRIPFLPTRPFL